jgi:myo-inositol catabolism protein IolC
VTYYHSDKPTAVQLEQARQITQSAVFSPEERRRWLLEIAGARSRFEARDMLSRLAAEFRCREREQEQEDAA